MRVEVPVPARDGVDPDPAVVPDARVLVDDGPLDDAPLPDPDVRLPFVGIPVLRRLVVVRSMQTTPSRLAPLSMMVLIPTIEFAMFAFVMMLPSAASDCEIVL